jgi:hypothetical protein
VLHLVTKEKVLPCWPLAFLEMKVGASSFWAASFLMTSLNDSRDARFCRQPNTWVKVADLMKRPWNDRLVNATLCSLHKKGACLL